MTTKEQEFIDSLKDKELKFLIKQKNKQTWITLFTSQYGNIIYQFPLKLVNKLDNDFYYNKESDIIIIPELFKIMIGEEAYQSVNKIIDNLNKKNLLIDMSPDSCTEMMTRVVRAESVLLKLGLIVKTKNDFTLVSKLVNNKSLVMTSNKFNLTELLKFINILIIDYRNNKKFIGFSNKSEINKMSDSSINKSFKNIDLELLYSIIDRKLIPELKIEDSWTTNNLYYTIIDDNRSIIKYIGVADNGILVNSIYPVTKDKIIITPIIDQKELHFKSI